MKPDWNDIFQKGEEGCLKKLYRTEISDTIVLILLATRCKMKKLVTMKDIAESLGVSVVTVSKALGGKGGSSPLLKEKILNKANELGYQYGVGNGEHTSKEIISYNIGVLIADRFFSSNAFYAEMYRNVIIEATNQKCITIMELVQKDAEDAGTLPGIIAAKKIDAIIFIGNFKESYLKKVICTGLPYVFLDSYDSGLQSDAIVSDNVTGMFRLTEYLIQKGHQYFCFVGSILATSSIMDRYLGCIKAVQQYKIPLDHITQVEDRDKDGKFIDCPIPDKLPDAYICNCDQAAFNLIERLKKSHYEIPRDVSVVGYDDYIYAKLCRPELTTYRVNMNGMAKLAVETLLQKMNSNSIVECNRVIAGELVIRDSVLQK